MSLLLADDEGVRHLRELGVADLRAELVRRRVDVGAEALGGRKAVAPRATDLKTMPLDAFVALMRKEATPPY